MPEKRGPQQPEALSTAALVRAALAVLAVVAAVLVLIRLSELVFVFVIAVVLSEGLRPAVDLLQRRGLHRELARALVYVILIGLIAASIAVLSRPVVVQARAVFAALPTYQAELQHALDQLSLETSVSSAVSDAAGTLARTGFSFAAGLARGLVDAVIVMRQAVGLQPLVIVLSLATGAAVGGVGGALIAVPIAFATQVVIVRAVAPAVRRRYAT